MNIQIIEPEAPVWSKLRQKIHAHVQSATIDTIQI